MCRRELKSWVAVHLLLRERRTGTQLFRSTNALRDWQSRAGMLAYQRVARSVTNCPFVPDYVAVWDLWYKIQASFERFPRFVFQFIDKTLFFALAVEQIRVNFEQSYLCTRLTPSVMQGSLGKIRHEEYGMPIEYDGICMQSRWKSGLWKHEYVNPANMTGSQILGHVKVPVYCMPAYRDTCVLHL